MRYDPFDSSLVVVALSTQEAVSSSTVGCHNFCHCLLLVNRAHLFPTRNSAMEQRRLLLLSRTTRKARKASMKRTASSGLFVIRT